MSVFIDFLSVLERREVSSLSWGVTDGAFTWDELEDLADKFIRDRDLDLSKDDLFDDLLRRGLLFDFEVKGELRLRTRMAEGVRLMARLRQLFPRHFPADQPPRWEAAARLVSDYRFLRRPRLYPDRHLPFQKLLKRIDEAGLQTSTTQRTVMEALVGKWELADFQVQATTQILQDLDGPRRPHATIIGAGTGTGKTMAFYLPGLAYIAQDITKDPRQGLRVLALYPRNELLKDQLATALSRIVTLNRLDTFRGRPLSLGALYGDVPAKASVKELRKWRKGWREIKGEGFACPFLRDPAADEGTGGELVWRYKDIEQGRERLIARDHPSRTYGPEGICLTRERMREEPPDILFSSTEMLNRSLSSVQNGSLYGVGKGVMAPRLVLLDEVHTYEGTTGAQVAYLLRRWTHAVKYKVAPVFVGLSATLASPRTFFSDLTGVPDYRVTPIQASDDVAHSDEYLLMLRGDPFSGPSLLSTSIQAAILLGRIMDPIQSRPSEGAYGQRVFLFTDDLDVTNRFYDDLASAEGLMKRNGRYVPNPRQDSLAALRSPLRERDDPTLFEAGQSWRLAEHIGHDLRNHLRVDRVSSQDQGLADDAALVVATSSLEVGFDDDRVGAVLQHKAPRGTASYLQRKGRAGRDPEMRPWTCIVLSAYGRDQIAYQNYENLVDPVVETEKLPLGNRYVLRIQATLACLDWLSKQVRESSGALAYIDPWKDLCGPATNDFQNRLRVGYLGIVEKLLEQPNGSLGRSLARHIQSALSIDEYEAQVLLWEPPRSIFLGVLPTLRRRLKGNWKIYGTEGSTERSTSPLPEFMPHALFGDLNLPEVALHLPGEEEPVLEAVDSVLRNYAPGRVNRRHATSSAYESHWLPIPHDVVSYELDLSTVEAFPSEDLGEFGYVSPTGIEETIRVMRPYGFQLSQTPREVKAQSNARPYWHTQIVAPPINALSDSARHAVPGASPLARYVEEIAFFTHERGQPIEMRRFTDRAEARLYVQQQRRAPTEEVDIDVTYARNGERVALGFLQSVDAIGFVVTMPEIEALRSMSFEDASQERALRTQYFHHVITHTADLVEANVFQRQWVARVLMAALIRRAVQDETTLQEAHAVLQGEGYTESLQRELALLADADVDPDTGEVIHGRHGQRLEDLLRDDGFVAEVSRHVPLLWEDLGTGFDAWLLERFRTTLGAVLLRTCAELTPGRSEDGLVLDLQSGPAAEEVPEEERDVVWVSELTLGGTGLVEAIVQHVHDYPNQFVQLVLHNLQASDLEQVATEMPRILEHLRTPGSVAEATERVRAAQTNADMQEATDALRHLLQEESILCTHSVFSALAVRLLRSGATRQTEELALELLDRWDEIEERLGVEVEPRLLAELVATDDAIEPLLPAAPATERNDPTWRSAVCYSLLWSRGSEVRALSLRPYHPYADLLPTDRRLVLDGLQVHAHRVSVVEEGWREAADEQLHQAGHVDLMAPADQAAVLREALDTYLFNAVEMEYLHLYPRLTSLYRDDGQFCATLILEEVAPT